ncbi:MAG: hypothetical protein GEU79_11465 [Acidimicrobiia bacterium]|nr:hypothetical protein [Acidimicrobiia bacterium]
MNDENWPEHLVEWRNQLPEADFRVGIEFNRAMLAISSGAIALSAVFLSIVADGTLPEAVPWLASIAIVFFVVALVITLFSLFWTRDAVHRTIDDVEKGKPYKDHIWPTRKYGLMALISFTIGFSMLGVGFLFFLTYGT